MKGGTMTRLAAMVGIIGGMFGRPITRHYDDPVMLDPRTRRKKRAHGHGSGRMGDVRPMIKRGRLGPPRCKPGTITYHDKLVKHFGRRVAEKYRRIIQDKKLTAAQLKQILPSDFSAHPPWRFLREQRR